MKRSGKAIDLLFLGMLSVAVSFVAAQALLTALLIDGMGQTLLYCAVFTVLWAAMLYNGATMLLLLLTPALAGIYSLMSFLWEERFPAIIDYDAVIGFFQWCREYIMSFSDPREDYLFILRLLVCALAGLFVYVFTVKRLSFTVIFFLGMGIFITQQLVGMAFSFRLFAAFLALSLLYWLLRSDRRRTDGGRGLPKAAGLVLFGLPLCALSVAAAGLLPVPGESLRNTAVEDTLLSAVSAVYEELIVGDIQPSGVFSLSQTGFGSVTNLSSRPILDSTPVMSVQTGGRSYLKGQIKDTYSGRSWTKSSRTPPSPLIGSNPYILEPEHAEMLANIYLYWWNLGFPEPIGRPPYLEESYVNITYRELRTRSLFVPSGIVWLYQVDGAGSPLELSGEPGGTVWSEEMIPEGYSYMAVTVLENLRDESLIAFLRSSRRGMYLEYGESIPFVSYDLGISETISAQELNGYAEAAYEYGLQLPAGLPERVRELAEELTGSYDNRYDKSKAIEQYLAENFTYTLTPRRAPLGRDYVDFLLFDSKEGFCTHFATAMAVLCRSAGIPARIAEGYALPTTPARLTEAGDAGIFEVTNDQAHAWVEVYFEGIGWIPFEPTPPYAALLYEEAVPVAYSEEFLNDPAAEEHRDLLEDFGNELPEPTEPEPVSPAVPEDTQEEAGAFPWPLLWTAGAGLLVLALALGPRELRRRRTGMFEKPPEQSITPLFEQTMRILRALNLRRAGSETLSEFASRAQDELALPQSGLAAAVRRYLPVRYGGKRPDERDREELLLCNGVLTEEAKRRLGRIRWALLRFTGLM